MPQNLACTSSGVQFASERGYLTCTSPRVQFASELGYLAPYRPRSPVCFRTWVFSTVQAQEPSLLPNLACTSPGVRFASELGYLALYKPGGPVYFEQNLGIWETVLPKGANTVCKAGHAGRSRVSTLFLFFSRQRFSAVTV